MEFAGGIVFEKGDITEPELYCLFDVSPCQFCCVFPYTEEIVEGDQSEVTNSSVKGSCIRKCSKISNELGYVCFNWKLHVHWWVDFASAVNHLCEVWEEFVGARDFCWVSPSGQGNHLANGRERANDCASRDLLAPTVESSSDSCSKASEDLDCVLIWRGLW